MALFLNEMKNYIRIAENSNFSSLEEVNEESPVKENNSFSENTKLIIDDIKEVLFKIQSHQNLSENQKYVNGFEEGLSYAAAMIEKVIEKYNTQQEDI